MPDNNRPNWSGAIEQFVRKLQDFADGQIRHEQLKPVLEDLRLTVYEIIYECVRLGLQFTKEDQKKRELFSSDIPDNLVPRLQKVCFPEELIKDVGVLADHLRKSDGSELSRVEKEIVSNLLREAMASVTIAIWFDPDEIVTLFDDPSAMVSFFHITVAVTRKLVVHKGCQPLMPGPLVAKKLLKKKFMQIKDPNVRDLFLKTLDNEGKNIGT